MWSKRVLEAYLHALVQTQNDTEGYIGELIAMIESEKLLHGKSYMPAMLGCSSLEAGFAYSLSWATKLDPELMMMSRIKPSLSLEIRSAMKPIDLTLRWKVKVVCMDYKHFWELATCSHSKKRCRTSFSSELILPLEANEDVSHGCWVTTLPSLQLNHEAGIRDQEVHECHLSDGRFQFHVCLINTRNERVSPIVHSSPFDLVSYTSRKNDQNIIKQAQRARMITSHIRKMEIEERVNTTRVFLLQERKHVLPKMTMISPCSITTSVQSEFKKEISGKNFHRPNVVRIDSDCDDADILKQSIIATTTSVFASVKVPSSPDTWILKVRNFDDPNLDSVEYHIINFVAPKEEEFEPEDECDSEMFDGLPPLFSLDSDYLSLPPPCSLDSVKEENVEVILERYKHLGKSSFLETDNFSFSEKSMFHYHIMNGYTHTVAAMLNSVESSNKLTLKMKFGVMPAMLSLLSENPCTVILCIALYYFEHREISFSDFKKFLGFILRVDRDIPLHPDVMLDFLEIELGFDARVRCVKMATMLSEAFLAEDDVYYSGDELSSQSDDEDEYASTSDEDYEEPPAKILKSTSSAPGAPLKISIKIEQAKDSSGFAHLTPLSCSPLSSLSPSLPPPNREKDEPESPHECEWGHCLVCERDIPIMLQTQNPTWAAIMRVVFFSFIQIFQDTEYWKVRQAYKYIEDHWDKLCPGKSQGVGAWRKQLQDALSHNKQYFMSGMHIFGQKGYWGLKQIIDPWAITDEVDFPKRAYNHQPRRGRPPKGSHKKRFLSKLKKKLLMQDLPLINYEDYLSLCSTCSLLFNCVNLIQERVVYRIPAGEKAIHDYRNVVVESVESIPPTAISVTFDDISNFENINSLPSSILELTFNEIFNYPISHLPPSLSSLTFGDLFDQPLPILPNSLTSISFGSFFNQSIDDLPSTLTSLKFDKCACIKSYFKQPIKLFPPSLKILKLPPKFNQNVDSLPASLTKLNFRRGFNQNVDNLPPQLVKLKFGRKFNRPVDNLPKSLKMLKFGQNFNQKVDFLPPTLYSIKFGTSFTTTMDSLPSTLKIISFAYGSQFNLPVDSLPQILSIQFSLAFNQLINHLPLSLRNLTLGYIFDQPINNLPSSLESLSIGNNFNCKIDHLPHSLRRLYFNGLKFNKPIDHLPSSLEVLQFARRCFFNHPVDHLPDSLETLVLGDHFNHPITHYPPSLRNLTFGVRFKQSLSNLPLSISNLTVGHKYNELLVSVPTGVQCKVVDYDYC